MSTVNIVADMIDKAPQGSFLSPGDLGIPSGAAAYMAWSRAARSRTDLVRIARGLYWKGAPTRFGLGRPNSIDVAIWRAGSRGVGPTGWLASNHLGLSTQVPAEPRLTTVSRPPKAVAGVSYSQRANLDRIDLSYSEIALLEVLRSYPDYVEVTWTKLVDRVRQLQSDGVINIRTCTRVATSERSSTLRNTLHRLILDLSAQ